MNRLLVNIAAAFSLGLCVTSCADQDANSRLAVTQQAKVSFGQPNQGLKLGLRASKDPARVLDIVVRNERTEPVIVSIDLNDLHHISAVGPDGKPVPGSGLIACGPGHFLKIAPGKEAYVPHSFTWERHEAKSLGKGLYSFSLNISVYEETRPIVLRSGKRIAFRE